MLQDMIPSAQEPTGQGTGWQMQKLTDKHRNLCTLLAQGIDRQTCATIMGITPEYVSMLVAQPLIKDEVRRITEYAGLSLESMFSKSVEAVGYVLDQGTNDEKLRAARLQMEATKRIGAGSLVPSTGEGEEDKLERLAQRLVQLQTKARQRAEVIEDVAFTEIQTSGTEVQEEGTCKENGAGNQPTQIAGNGAGYTTATG